MDFPIQAPRTDATALSYSPLQRPLPEAVSTAPETARPVLAAERSGAASGTKGESFQPLDMYEVGDNDRMPVPPEPPRTAAVLAIMADAPPVTDVKGPVPPQSDPMADTLRVIDKGPANPTVDIRS